LRIELGAAKLDAAKLITIFGTSLIACMLLFLFLAIYGKLGFTIDPKDLDNIIFLILVVGVVSILGMVAASLAEGVEVMLLGIFIVVVAFAGFLAGVILTDSPSAEKEVAEKTIAEKTATKTVTERTIAVTLVEGTKKLQKEELTLLDVFITIFGISSIIAAVIAYSYAALTGFDP
jgi:predicted permease